MSYLARKINATKWRQVDLETVTDVSADAITSSLKTQDNSLSFWEISSIDNLDQAALALAAASQQLETIDVVTVLKDDLHQTGLELNKSEGKTEVEDLKNTHFDIIKLTYSKLGIIASHIIASFKVNRVKRYTRDELRRLLNLAIQEGRLQKEDLPDSIKLKL